MGIRIEELRKNRWEKFFEKLGLDLSSGVRVAVEKYIRDFSSDVLSPNLDITTRIDNLIESLDKFERIALEKERLVELKEKKVNEIQYEFPEDITYHDYEVSKVVILEKLETYGCLGITQLSQLTEIEGKWLLLFLKRMKKEPDSKIILNKDYEWCLSE